MLKGHVFSEQTFDVRMFALFINQFLGGNNGIIQSYKNAMAMTNTANSITIGTGAVVVQGRFIEEHTETTVNFAKTEVLYCSLVLEIDLGQTNTTTVLNQAQYKILENSSNYPTLIQNDIINQTGNIYQFELARFQNGATGIVNFTDRRTYLNFDSIYSGIIQNNLTSDSITSALSAKQGKVLNEKINGLILYYDNYTGENEELTLSETSANFDYLEIFYRSGNSYNSVKIYQPNGKAFTCIIKSAETTLLQLDCARFLISGTDITLAQCQRINLGSSYLAPWDASNVYITKVIGYKII